MQLTVQRLLGTNANSSVRTLRAVPTNLWGLAKPPRILGHQEWR